MTRAKSIVMDSKVKMALKILNITSPKNSPKRDRSGSNRRLNTKYRKGSQGILFRNNSVQRDMVYRHLTHFKDDSKQISKNRVHHRRIKDRRRTENQILDGKMSDYSKQVRYVQTLL